MVWPAAIMAGAGIGSALMGLFDDTDAQIANANLQEQRANRFLMEQIANQQMRMGQAGSYDANGNLTRYNPATNTWELDLTPTTQSIINAWNSEELKRGTQDQYDSRQERQLALQRRLQEGGTADSFLTQLMQPSPYNQNAIQAALLERMTSGVNEGFDREQNNVMRQALRGGVDQGSIGNILAEFSNNRADALGQAEANSYLQSLESSSALEGARTGRLGNLYNLFATRAANINNAPFAPSGIESGAESNLAASRALVPQSLGLAGSLLGRSVPQMQNYQGGLTKAGLALGSIGDALSGLFDYSGSNALFGDRQLGNQLSNGVLGARGTGNANLRI